MKKWMGIVVALAALGAGGCNDDSTWDTYEAWRNSNLTFFAQKEAQKDPVTGEALFEQVIPDWNSGVYVLSRKYKQGTGRRPYLTSRIAMKFKGVLSNGFAFDSSYTATDSLYVNQVDSLIGGLEIALQYMVEGDSCEIVIPSDLGYGSNIQYTSSGGVKVPPYSTLVFGVELKEIVDWEKP